MFSVFYSSKIKSLLPILIIVVAGLVSVLPTIVFGFPFLTHDGTTHTIFYTNFAEQFWAGELYPRWLIQMNAGLGSPTFFYYPPLAYYLTVPFYFLSEIDPNGWRQLGLAVSLVQIASGLCAYLWLKEFASRTGAAIAAVLYIWMPYHLALDLYVRAAFAELCTFVWMPLILYFTHKISNGRRSAVVGLAVSYGLLIASHLPTTLIFSLLPICYAVCLAKKDKKLIAVFLVSAAMLLGICLSAVYLLPALLMQKYVQMQVMFDWGYSYKNYFLFTGLSPWNENKRYFWIFFGEIALALCVYPLCKTRKYEARLWLIVIMICTFMMSPLSFPIWQALTALQKIQFPWRFNTVICIALSGLLALSFSSFKRPYFASNKKLKIFALLIIIAWLPYTIRQASRAFPATFDDPQYVAMMVAYNNRKIELGIEEQSAQNAWSIPYTERNPQLTESEYQSLFARVNDTNGKLIKTKVLEGTAAVTILQWKPREIDLQIAAETEAKLNVSQFYFPGWVARLDNETKIPIQSSVPDGLLSINIPKGNYRLSLRLEQNTAERAGQIISFVSLIIVMILLGVIIVCQRSRFRNLFSQD